MGVLDGIKILELARVPPAEMPGMMLADMGADVLKIETPSDTQEDPDWQRRSAFVYVNRNKRSLALNMKAPEGQGLFKKLAAGADVIIEGFRPGVMKRLGADYETLRATNPRLVYCSLSGFGQNGPYRDYPAHDMNYLSLAGVLGLIGEADRKPAIPLNLV
ncbi:MAG TPA: CaiB/BaiF CoA-transferase family protein, partial [Candidatus Eisenbacteria bacterium]|nr:CaiB/BaiF CoA-transferase family protein [Candidatus Eisenbacteria bacterium]